MNLKSKHASSPAAFALAAALMLLLGSSVEAQEVVATADGVQTLRCRNATIRGNYAFAIDGVIFPPGGAPTLTVRAVAMTTFDGKGGLFQVDHATFNGVPAWSGWRPATGSYSINPDCTGTAEIVPSNGGPTLQLHLVVSDEGRRIDTVVDGNASGSVGIRVK